jgi:hypothetical protein
MQVGALFGYTEQSFLSYPVFSLESNSQNAAHRVRHPRLENTPDPSTRTRKEPTMKRNLIVAVALALGANVAFAQDQFADGYWKQLDTVQSAQSAQATGNANARNSWVDETPAQ